MNSQLQNSQINLNSKILVQARDLTKSQQILIKTSLITTTNDHTEGDQKQQPINQNQASERFQQTKIDWTFSNIWENYKSIVLAVIFGTLLVISGIVVLIVVLTKNSSNSNNNLNAIPHTDQQVYDLVKLNSTSAICLDGSTAGYYLSRTGDPSKIFLYFQYGGWCGHLDYQKTLDSCYQRSNTKYGSMGSATTGTATYSQGVLSNNQKNYFKDWKKVYLRYCDGSGHQGTREDPILHNGKLLYFRGHNITVERFESLQEKIGLFSNSLQIVVSGESAGGLASMMWSNYVADRAIRATVRSIPGEGIFYDSYHNQYNDYFLRQSFKNIANITNQEIDIPIPQCVSSFPTNKQKCFFVQYLHQFVRVPTFMIQPLYDSYSIPNVIGVTCNDMQRDSFTNCDPSQRSLIENYKNNLTNVLIDISSKPGNGVWGISCPVHIFMTKTNLYDEFYRIPQYSVNSANEAIKNWMQNIPINHTSIDTAIWPNNHPCQAYQ